MRNYTELYKLHVFREYNWWELTITAEVQNCERLQMSQRLPRPPVWGARSPQRVLLELRHPPCSLTALFPHRPGLRRHLQSSPWTRQGRNKYVDFFTLFNKVNKAMLFPFPYLFFNKKEVLCLKVYLCVSKWNEQRGGAAWWRAAALQWDCLPAAFSLCGVWVRGPALKWSSRLYYILETDPLSTVLDLTISSPLIVHIKNAHKITQ